MVFFGLNEAKVSLAKALLWMGYNEGLVRYSWCVLLVQLPPYFGEVSTQFLPLLRSAWFVPSEGPGSTGAFFTEGSVTKNSPGEVADMMRLLEAGRGLVGHCLVLGI